MNDFSPETPPSAPKEHQDTPPLDEAARREAIEKAAREADEEAARERTQADTAAALATHQLGVEVPAEVPELDQKKDLLEQVKEFFSNPVATMKGWFEKVKGWFKGKKEEGPSTPPSNPQTPPVEPEVPPTPNAPDPDAEPESESPYQSFLPGTFDFDKGTVFSLSLKDGTKIQIPAGGKIIIIDGNQLRLSTSVMMSTVAVNIKSLVTKADRSASLVMAAMGREETVELSAPNTLNLMTVLSENKDKDTFRYLSPNGRPLVFTRV